MIEKRGKEPKLPWRDQTVRNKIELAINARCFAEISLQDVDNTRKALGILPKKDKIKQEDKEHVCNLIAEKPEEVRHLNIVADMLYPYEY